MGKGKSISDFSKLGKLLSGTEAPDVSSGRSSVSDCSQFRPGRRVILMDFDIHGKIVSAGKTLKVEIEEGLVIDADYSEVAIADAREEELMVRSLEKGPVSGTSSGRFHGRVRPGYSTRLTVDLHIEAIPGGRSVPAGNRLGFQLEYFRKVMRESLRHPGMRITFIHGVGDGILKNALRQDLDDMFALRCTWTPGPAGITSVTIK